MIPSLLSRLSDNHPCELEDNYHCEEKPEETLLKELMMMLMSRTRTPDIEDIQYVNASVLNYGIDESFSRVREVNKRKSTIEKRLMNAIARFEPRLTDMSVASHTGKNQNIIFTLQGYYAQYPVLFELEWDDCNGRFYLHE
ncbi:GPW/gp25 family protein [Cedecea neteri]|uniref:IraD/Gp25-like domain-containing protein n=1 Tax=Cedecea neteri TaxID=158822 RepID=A0AAN0VTP8_9ENTR|nr:GPW/gp25 family protein [Cedecea neteri]AIR61121.1 hypothetical protein LH23_10715 [Cedecea neteri]WNJ78504.1 GPW/gp25 family protein [Cedecea neteri]